MPKSKVSIAMPPCVFCRIAAREIEAHLIHEDDLTSAFLDSHPIRPGHLQIIPRGHYATFDEMPPDTGARIMHVGQRLAKALKKISGVERVAFLFTGSDVSHAHAHLLPMHEKTDITSRRFIAEERLTFQPMRAATSEDLSRVAQSLRSALDHVAE